MATKDLKIYKQTELPATWEADAIYFVKTGQFSISKLYIDGTEVRSDFGINSFSRITMGDFWTDNVYSGPIYIDDIKIKDLNNNIIFTEDFEAGLSNWTIGAGNPATSTDQAHSGTHSYKISSDREFISKNFTLASDQTITIWIYDDISLAHVSVMVSVDNVSSFVAMGMDKSVNSNNYFIRIGSTYYDSGIARSTGWHELRWEYRSAAQVYLYVTDLNNNQYEVGSYSLDLDNVLGRGNVSTKNITAGKITGTGLAISNINMSGVRLLGTDNTGNIIQAPEPSVYKVTATYTIAANDDTVLCDPAIGAFTVILPSAPVQGKIYTIKNIGTTQGVLITISTSDSIEGSTSVTLDAGEKLRIQWSESDSIWYKI